MNRDDRLPLAKAYQRATRGITVAVGMVAPGLFGYWLDSRVGTRAVFTIIGFALGMTYGMLELIRMGRPGRTDESANGQRPEADSANDKPDSADH